MQPPAHEAEGTSPSVPDAHEQMREEAGENAFASVPDFVEIQMFPPPTEDEFEQAVADGLWPPRGGRFMSNSGRFILDVRVAPDPIPLNALFDLDVRVYHAPAQDAAPKNDQAVDRRLSDDELARARPADVQLMVDARMPEHRHGMNLYPAVRRNGAGHFHITDMLLHMPGYWEITFDIATPEGTERAQMAIFLD